MRESSSNTTTISQLRKDGLLTENSSVQEMYSLGVKRAELEELFPNLARDSVFDQARSKFRTFQQLLNKEDEADKQEVKKIYQRATSTTLQQNKAKVVRPYEFGPSVDDLVNDIHTRLFLRAPVSDPRQWMIAHRESGKDLFPQLPIDDYKFSHVNLSGQVTPLGVQQGHNQGCLDFSLNNFHESNFNKASNRSQQIRIGSNDGQSTTFETEDSTVQINSMPDFLMAFNNAELYRRRACLIDCSFEPIRRFFDLNVYFLGDRLAPIRGGMQPGIFCAKFAEHIIKKNAARYEDGEGFMTLSDIQTEFNSYQVMIV